MPAGMGSKHMGVCVCVWIVETNFASRHVVASRCECLCRWLISIRR